MVKVIQMKKESPTIQIGLRIDKKLLESIDFFAEKNKEDRMAMIRMAIASYVDEMETALEDAAIEDYISGRIDENELKDATGMKNIPEDLRKTRSDTLTAISRKRIKGE
jgi:predicted transcriptional regulator